MFRRIFLQLFTNIYVNLSVMERYLAISKRGIVDNKLKVWYTLVAYNLSVVTESPAKDNHHACDQGTKNALKWILGLSLNQHVIQDMFSSCKLWRISLSPNPPMRVLNMTKNDLNFSYAHGILLLVIQKKLKIPCKFMRYHCSWLSFKKLA